MNKVDKRFCLYLHIRPDTMQVFYVGIGIKHRPGKRRNRNNHWNNIVNKNNGEFIFEVLCEHQTWTEVCQMEIALIKFYGRQDIGTGILCNMTDGGDGVTGMRGKTSWIKGKTHSEETRKKIREALAISMSCPEYRKSQSDKLRGRPVSLETRQKISQSQIGKVVSLESRVKMSISAKGKIITEETRRKIKDKRLGTIQSRNHVVNTKIANFISRGWVIDQVCPITNNVVNTYLTTYLASASTGAGRCCITTVMNGNQKSAGGYLWRRNYNKDILNRLINEYELASKIEAA